MVRLGGFGAPRVSGRVLASAALLAVCTGSLLLVHIGDLVRGQGASALIEIDGIELDSNAAAVLGSGDGKHSRHSGMTTDPTDKMLHAHEVGELDGVALDANAAAKLVSNPVIHVSTLSSKGTRSKAKRSGVDQPAQELMQSGEAELSAGRYRSAVNLLRKARDLWKSQGSNDYHFAQTLMDDVRRAHPEAKGHAEAKVGHAGASLHLQKRRVHHSSRMRIAAKKLSSGKAFRSLYGLLRDEHAGKESSSHAQENQVQDRATGRPQLKLAQTMSLAEESPKPEESEIQKSVDKALRKAELRLEKRNKLVLLHEKAEILRSAKKFLSAQGFAPAQGVQYVPQQSLAAGAPVQYYQPSGGVQYPQQVANTQLQQAPVQAQAPLMSWPSNQVPSSVKLSWPATQLASESNVQVQESAPKATSQEMSLASQPQGEPQAAAPSQDWNQILSQNAQGHSAVPVINLNLPAGQKLPPGRYALDGSVVPDAAGQLDFVGNLVPVSPPGVI